jgi:hypothetical protein
VSYFELEEGNIEIYGDIISRGSQQFEEQETAVNESRRSKAVSLTHTICNLGVCLSLCCSN